MTNSRFWWLGAAILLGGVALWLFRRYRAEQNRRLAEFVRSQERIERAAQVYSWIFEALKSPGPASGTLQGLLNSTGVKLRDDAERAEVCRRILDRHKELPSWFSSIPNLPLLEFLHFCAERRQSIRGAQEAAKAVELFTRQDTSSQVRQPHGAHC